MAKANVIADVRSTCTKAIKQGDTAVQPPSKWASAAGYTGSAASPLRQHMARSNGNGCGRTQRYPAVNAEGMLELLDLADAYQAEKEQRKRDATARKIGTKLRPAAARGAKAAKAQTKDTARKTRAAKKATKAAPEPDKVAA